MRRPMRPRSAARLGTVGIVDMHEKSSSRLALGCWLALAVPLIAIGLTAQRTGLGFPRAWANWGVITGFVVAGITVLTARGHTFGRASWPLAWLIYLLALVFSLSEAISFYFQASTFNTRFFANLRLASLGTTLHAFPWMFIGVMAALATLLTLAGYWLRAVSRSSTLQSTGRFYRAATVFLLTTATLLLPSPWQRLGTFLVQYRRLNAFADHATGSQLRGLADPDPLPRDQVRAAAGKNLVMIYMESLERIYTDEHIFPGLTPNLNRWRAEGLDYTGYLTFTGADYTIAGLFSSQCGAPYLPSPVRALELGGNDANATSFQPSLACLGDVLHAAGYDQVFMNGVDLSFADDGTFFRLHGFDQVLGLQQLEKANGNALPQPGWGIYDSDLFRIAATKFEKLARLGRPFNLDVLTIDNHPPHGRPSPGCPRYAANPDDVLQAVHCTDALVGKFLDKISAMPAWKNTIVVVMSDHQSLRNDAWSLYPPSYKRHPLLFVLNGGQGRRDMRFYHMDIAPTVLHLMGVRTNATFLAGSDRSAANAPGSPLVDDDADVAILRHAVWARVQPLQLCRDGVLVGAADNGVRLGGNPVPMSWRGRREVGLSSENAWLVWIGSHSVHGVVLDGSTDLDAIADATSTGAVLLGHSAEQGFRQALMTMRASGESALAVTPLAGSDPQRQFSVDWIGSSGGRTHLADVPRLRDLEIRSPACASLLNRMNTLPSGQTQDLHARFTATTAALYPQLPSRPLRFDSAAALSYTRDFGWSKPEVWGSFTEGAAASLGFTLPRNQCHAMDFAFKVRPFVPVSRPALDVRVFANGVLMTTWHFDQRDIKQTWHNVTTLVQTPDSQCRADLRFVFSRPGASSPPYPKDEDPRPLQLLFLDMTPTPPSSAFAAAH